MNTVSRNGTDTLNEHLYRQSSHASSRALWKRAHTLFVQALKEPPNPTQAKLLTRLKGKNTLSPAVEDTLFSWEGFLLGLGKMSLSTWILLHASATK